MIQTPLLACLSWFLVKEQRNVSEEKTSGDVAF